MIDVKMEIIGYYITSGFLEPFSSSLESREGQRTDLYTECRKKCGENVRKMSKLNENF